MSGQIIFFKHYGYGFSNNQNAVLWLTTLHYHFVLLK